MCVPPRSSRIPLYVFTFRGVSHAGFLNCISRPKARDRLEMARAPGRGRGDFWSDATSNYEQIRNGPWDRLDESLFFDVVMRPTFRRPCSIGNCGKDERHYRDFLSPRRPRRYFERSRQRAWPFPSTHRRHRTQSSKWTVYIRLWSFIFTRFNVHVCFKKARTVF